MLDFIIKAFRAKRHEEEPVGARNALEELHLRLGAVTTLDTLPYKIHSESFLFTPPISDQPIESYGHIDLGAGAALHRYYLTDDAWLQISMTDGIMDELKYWIFHDTKNPATRIEFDQWLKEGSLLGRSNIEYANKQYTRVWGEDAHWAPPILFTESVYNESVDNKSYTTDHHCMLFERAVPNTDRMEYLLISAELTGSEFCIVFNIGVDVTTADLQIA